MSNGGNQNIRGRLNTWAQTLGSGTKLWCFSSSVLALNAPEFIQIISA